MTAKSKEYRVFEIDKYGNRWFEMSFSGLADIQKRNAEQFVRNIKDGRKFEIEEVG